MTKYNFSDVGVGSLLFHHFFYKDINRINHILVVIDCIAR